MATNEYNGFIDGKTFSVDIDPTAENLSVQMRLKYSDGTDIIAADGTNISNNVQQVYYDFTSTPATATRYTRGLDRIGDRLNNDAVLAMVGDSTTDGLGFAIDTGGVNGLNSRFYAAAMLNWTPTRWKGYFSPISTSSPFMSGGFGSSIQDFVTKPLSVANPGAASDILEGVGSGHQFKGAPVFYFDSSDTNTNWAFRTGNAMDGTDNTSPSSTLYDWEDVFKESSGEFQVFMNPGERYEYKFCHIRTQALTSGAAYNPNSNPYPIPAGAAVINEPTMQLKTGGNFPWSNTEPRTYVYDTVAAPSDGVAYAWHTAEGTIRSDVNKELINTNSVDTQNGPGLNIYPPSGGTWGSAGNATGGVIIPVGTMVRRTEGTGLTIVDMGISGARSSDHASAYVKNTQSEFGYTDAALATIFDEAQIDTVMITVGINDTTSGSADYTPAEHKAYVQGIINRYRAQHAASGVTREFRAIVNIPPTWRPESAKRDQMETYREPILELADENEDVCVLDMQLWWYDTYGPYANYGFGAPAEDQQLLQTVGAFTDGTHPNPIGGQNFVQQVWKYVSTGVDDETPGPYVPPPSEPDLLASMVKTEDGSPALNEISGSWYTQSPGCYTVTNNVTPQVATATSVYPRLIAVNGQLVAQIAFGSGGKRDQFVSTHGDDMYVKITIDNNGSTYEGTSKSIAQLNALYGDPSAPGYTNGLDPQRADSETLLRVAIEPTEWVGGIPEPNSDDGYGSNLGWDVNMGVTIEILSPAE